MLSGCQVHRFVVLHKELDADDGELTRTRKVRRRIIEEKYADIIAALYDGSRPVGRPSTEVTYEDGRKGSAFQGDVGSVRDGEGGICSDARGWRRNDSDDALRRRHRHRLAPKVPSQDRASKRAESCAIPSLG